MARRQAGAKGVDPTIVVLPHPGQEDQQDQRKDQYTPQRLARRTVCLSKFHGFLLQEQKNQVKYQVRDR